MNNEIDDIFTTKKNRKTVKNENMKIAANGRENAKLAANGKENKIMKANKNKKIVANKNKKTAAKQNIIKKEEGKQKNGDTNNVSDSDDFDIRGKKTQNRKCTENGFVIYEQGDIKFGKNKGDTKDCPFDCHCCF